MPHQSRSGACAVMGCLCSPGLLLLSVAVILPGDGPHGNVLLVALGLGLLAVAGVLLLLQAILAALLPTLQVRERPTEPPPDAPE